MKPFAKGECDFCPAKDTDLFQILPSKDGYCIKCYQAEIKVIEDNKSFAKVMESTAKVDSNISLKADIFNAATVSFIELKTSIMNDETIPAANKNEVFVQQCEARIKKYNDVIFAEKAATMIKENERAAMVKQTREFIATLQAEQREKFKKYDINYTPAPVTKKAVKGKTPKVGSTKSGVKFNMAEAKRMAEKYGVDAVAIQSIVVSKNVPYEEAARQMATILGLPLPVEAGK